MGAKFVPMFVVIAGLSLCSAAAGAIIASDSFLTTSTATAGYYQATNINGQTATNGTTGYYTGATTSSQIAGWQSGTGAFQPSLTVLSHPLTVGAPTSTPDGSLYALGNANNRLQYRDLANTSPPASSTYYFSALLRESVNSYTGIALAGLGPSQIAGQYAIVPAVGFDVGFVNGALTLFYNNGGTDFTAAQNQMTLLAAPTAGSTYMAELAISVSGTTATITPTIYDSSGLLVNNPVLQTVTGTLNSTDMGAFQAYVSSNINAGSPAAIYFDEFRFGTAAADVIAVPEPATLVLLLTAASLFCIRRRRAKRR